MLSVVVSTGVSGLYVPTLLGFKIITVAVPSSDEISTTLYLYVRKSDAGFINTPVPSVFVTSFPLTVALKFPAPIPPTAIYNSANPAFWN